MFWKSYIHYIMYVQNKQWALKNPSDLSEYFSEYTDTCFSDGYLTRNVKPL